MFCGEQLMTDHFLYKASLRSYTDLELAEAFADVITERMFQLESNDTDYMDDLNTVRILVVEEIRRRKNN